MGRAAAQETASGSIRGVVLDKDFDAPLPAVKVLAVETGQTVTTTDQGQYVFAQVAPGRYTLVFSKDGYVRQVRTDVLVTSGQLTDVDAALPGEFTDMEEFVVEDVLQLGAGTEASLLALRFESPALLDSISADLLSRAGASDAAGALKLVSGASVQDGKYAVIRGMPDRYVSSQMNGVRLPTADEDKRAVELDQFPAPIIESIQVSKTFTPDQQGDASGGAVDIRLKGIPDNATLQFSGQTSVNTQVAGSGEFLTYEGGGVNFLGRDVGDHAPQPVPSDWDGAAGTSTTDAPIDYKWSIAGGGKFEVSNGVRIGGFASVFYERDSSFYDDGKSDSYWVVDPGDPMTPQTSQGTPSQGTFNTALYDITRATQSVQWGTLGTFGIETDDHAVNLTYLYTHEAEDSATLAVDTRGKEYYFPGYNPRNSTGPGNDPSERMAAPYQRIETLEYTERTTGTLQLSGRNRIPMGDFRLGDAFEFKEPELTWTISKSFADIEQPDKRQFGAIWLPASYDTVFDFTNPAIWLPLKPAENTNLGNFQRTYKSITEDSSQASFDLKFPFEQWNDQKGYLKFGLFDDQVDREFDQDSFGNFNDETAFLGGFDEPWSHVFPDEAHSISASNYDIDYRGEMDIFATYGMFDLPVTSDVNLIAGARFESTRIITINDAEPDALWYPPGASAGVELGDGQADVDFSQDDTLPALGLNYRPIEVITLRAAYSQTIARQTFKELTPVIQQEYAGAPIFIGNPDLQMSQLTNYDLRLDYTPVAGSLISVSWFKKDIDDPIEYVQRISPFTYTTPRNYPKGELHGFEAEVRQDLGNLWDSMEGFAVGVNGTLIDSSVTLPDAEAAVFAGDELEAPMTERDATNAPEYLFNAYFTYDIASTGTQIALFYTLQGDTLVAGAGESAGNFVPNVYATSFDTLNLNVSQKLGKYFKLTFQAKNLTNPAIEEVYRSEFIGDDVTKTSYTRGIEYSISLGATFEF